MNVLGRHIARFLNAPLQGYEPATPPDFEALKNTLKPADVLLVEGNLRISSIIKYLTQSTWSHSILYVGEIKGRFEPDGEPHVLIEAEVDEGVISSPLSKYKDMHVRICRPIGLEPEDRKTVINFMVERIGHDYDLKNVIDLARYLIPLPIPARFRRRLISLGSGDPTRAICSTLIAQAFESVRYPILPKIKRNKGHNKAASIYSRKEILHIRHHSLYAPRDFDISPYFAIIKPTIETGFDYKKLHWAKTKQA